jgi:hypothetical protein
MVFTAGRWFLLVVRFPPSIKPLNTITLTPYLMNITKTFKELERFLTNMLLVALPTIACIDK